MKTKFIFVTGGVLSGLGKGVTAASIGNILKGRGFKVWMQKFDQYLNVDAGTLNPNEHGEVYVLADGAETDLDLGHYERFIDTELNRTSSVMSGQIYQAILEKERAGKFLGKTIQVIPHVTDEVKQRMFHAARQSNCDVLITEIGGTIGDYEGTHFVEAIRQMQHEVGKDNVLYVHVGFIPYLGASAELKTKPLQNSVHDLQAMGIQPDVLVARSDYPVAKELVKKIALFTGVDLEAVIPLETVDSIYKVPQILEDLELDKIIIKKLKLKPKRKNNKSWREFLTKLTKPKKGKIKIALIAKYLGLKDTYFSVTESLKLAAIHSGVDVQIDWVDAEELEKSLSSKLSVLRSYDGIIVPGGFGSRGVEGKIAAIKYAREHKIPFLGLCYGLQLATIEFARNVAQIKNANSEEIDPQTPDPVIHIMPEQEKLLLGANYGGTMRLGAYDCLIKSNTLAHKVYSQQAKDPCKENELDGQQSTVNGKTLGDFVVQERHRHRYEVNNKYREILESKGLIFSGNSPDGLLAEMIELPKHPYFIATQAHPEFKSRPTRPHPLFLGFIKAAKK